VKNEAVFNSSMSQNMKHCEVMTSFLDKASKFFPVLGHKIASPFQGTRFPRAFELFMDSVLCNATISYEVSELGTTSTQV
jgi:hypothetical protein